MPYKMPRARKRESKKEGVMGITSEKAEEIIKKLDEYILPLSRREYVDPDIIEGFRNEMADLLKRGNWREIRESIMMFLEDHGSVRAEPSDETKKAMIGGYLILTKELKYLPGGEKLWKKVKKVAKRYLDETSRYDKFMGYDYAE